MYNFDLRRALFKNRNILHQLLKLDDLKDNLHF